MFVMVNVLDGTEDSIEAPTWRGAQTSPGSIERGMYRSGFPRNLGDLVVSTQNPGRASR